MGGQVFCTADFASWEALAPGFPSAAKARATHECQDLSCLDAGPSAEPSITAPHAPAVPSVLWCMLRPYPLCSALAVPSVCGSVLRTSSGRTLCVLLRAIPSLFVDLFCGSPLPLFSFSCPSLWTHFGHTLGGLLALLLTLGGLLLTQSQTNKQCTHACPQLLTCSRPCSCPRTPSSHTITPRLNAPSAQSVCARGSCTSLAPPPPTASGWGRTARVVSS